MKNYLVNLLNRLPIQQGDLIIEQKIAKEKYRYCCSVLGGYEDNSKQPVDLFDLRRTPFNDISLSEFINVVNGFYDLVYQASELLFTKEKSAAEKK